MTTLTIDEIRQAVCDLAANQSYAMAHRELDVVTPLTISMLHTDVAKNMLLEAIRMVATAHIEIRRYDHKPDVCNAWHGYQGDDHSVCPDYPHAV